MEKNRWSISIKPRANPFKLNIQEIVDYKDLIFLFVKRDFVTVHKQTIFGPLWHIIQPLLTSLTFYIVFNQIAKLSTLGVPPLLFYMSGTVIWSYFSSCVSKSSNVFIGNASIFGKVYFPRLTVPISFLFSNTISFVFQFVVLLCIVAYYSLTNTFSGINANLLLVPVVLLVLGLQGISIGLIISSLTTKYRDLIFLVNFGIQLLMYLSPVIYATSSLPENMKGYMMLNPMASFIELFRYSVCGVGKPDLQGIIIGTVISVVLAAIALIVFNKTERSVVDTI